MNTSRMCGLILLFSFLNLEDVYTIGPNDSRIHQNIGYGRPIEDMRRIVYRKESYASQIGWQ